MGGAITGGGETPEKKKKNNQVVVKEEGEGRGETFSRVEGKVPMSKNLDGRYRQCIAQNTRGIVDKKGLGCAGEKKQPQPLGYVGSRAHGEIASEKRNSGIDPGVIGGWGGESKNHGWGRHGFGFAQKSCAIAGDD